MTELPPHLFSASVRSCHRRTAGARASVLSPAIEPRGSRNRRCPVKTPAVNAARFDEALPSPHPLRGGLIGGSNACRKGGGAQGESYFRRGKGVDCWMRKSENAPVASALRKPDAIQYCPGLGGKRTLHERVSARLAAHAAVWKSKSAPRKEGQIVSRANAVKFKNMLNFESVLHSLQPYA